MGDRKAFKVIAKHRKKLSCSNTYSAEFEGNWLSKRWFAPIWSQRFASLALQAPMMK